MGKSARFSAGTFQSHFPQFTSHVPFRLLLQQDVTRPVVARSDSRFGVSAWPRRFMLVVAVTTAVVVVIVAV